MGYSKINVSRGKENIRQPYHRETKPRVPYEQLEFKFTYKEVTENGE